MLVCSSIVFPSPIVLLPSCMHALCTLLDAIMCLNSRHHYRASTRYSIGPISFAFAFAPTERTSQLASIMADDFDDLFKSPTSQSGAGMPAPSTPGWGGGFGDDDDLATANPFADLQSSRLYESQINSANEEDHDHQQSTPTSPEALSGQFEKQASLSRRSTASSRASASAPRGGAGVQRSNSTSSAASTASGAGEDVRTAPSSSEGGREQRGDRVAVSPFIAPSDNYEGAENGSTSSTAQLSRSGNTIGEPRHPRQDTQPFWSRTASSSIYDQDENATFGGGFNDTGGFQDHSDSNAPPSLNVHRAPDDEPGSEYNDEYENNDQLRARDAEDAGSIRTVGLDSDTASLRSHRVSRSIQACPFSLT